MRLKSARDIAEVKLICFEDQEVGDQAMANESECVASSIGEIARLRLQERVCVCQKKHQLREEWVTETEIER